MNRLREARVIKRITQFKLQAVTGIPASKISLIENGWVVPHEDEKTKLAKALEVEVEEIWKKGETHVQHKGGEYAK